MEKIVIPNIGTVEASELSYFLCQLDRVNGMLHDGELTDEEFIVAGCHAASAIRAFFKHQVEHTEAISCIRPLHRNLDSDGQERFCRNTLSRLCSLPHFEPKEGPQPA